VILREPGGTTHEIERSVWLELHEGYHTTSSQLSRFGNSARKNAEPLGTKTIARKHVRTGISPQHHTLREAVQDVPRA
jgi:hypothetical protein